jgi:hypothetical protein
MKMFGHKNDDQDDNQTSTQPVNITVQSDQPTTNQVDEPMSGVTEVTAGGLASDEQTDETQETAPVLNEDPAESTSDQETSSEVDNSFAPVNATLAAEDSSAASATAPVNDPATEPEPEANDLTAGPVMTDAGDEAGDLASLKAEALKELSSIVEHINQPPEEKLKTIMQMFEETKDKNLLKHAFDTAKQVTDQAQRAQSLLEIVKLIDSAS